MRQVAFFAISLLWAAVAASAACVPLDEISLSAGATLRAGEDVSLAWPTLPSDTDEFELLLLCEEPLRLKVRLTESRSPDITRFTWRVPAFPSGRARLLLRRGGLGGERLWARSHPFEIRSALGQMVHSVEWRSGELWLSEERAPSTLGSTPSQASVPFGEGHPPVIPADGCASSLPPVSTSQSHAGNRLRAVVLLKAPVHRSVLPLQFPLRI